jgi:hypothetical protein
MPTFRNTLSVPSSKMDRCWCYGTLCLLHLHRFCKLTPHIKMEQCSETSAYKNSDIGKSPKIKNTTFISLQKIIRVINSRRMGWAGHEAPTGEKRDAYRVLVRKHEGKRPHEGSSSDGRMTLQWILKKQDGKTCTEIQNNGKEKDIQLGL